MKAFSFLTALAVLGTSLTALADRCSWVGSAGSCRERPVGAACTTDGGYAGICATTHWDRCACAKVVGHHTWYEEDEDDDEVTYLVVRPVPVYRPRVYVPAPPPVYVPAPSISVSLPGISLSFP